MQPFCPAISKGHLVLTISNFTCQTISIRGQEIAQKNVLLALEQDQSYKAASFYHY